MSTQPESLYIGIERLKRDFLAGLSSRIDCLEEAMENQNWDDVKKQAHQLKGTSGCFGLSVLQILASNIEAAASKEETSHCLDFIVQMKQYSRKNVQLNLEGSANKV